MNEKTVKQLFVEACPSPEHLEKWLLTNLTALRKRLTVEVYVGKDGKPQWTILRKEEEPGSPPVGMVRVPQELEETLELIPGAWYWPEFLLERMPTGTNLSVADVISMCKDD